MMYAGARGETASQMATTLHFDLQQERLHPAFNALDLSLTAGSAGEGDFVLRVANALWGQTGYGFLGSYLDTLAQNYGAGVRLTSFVADPEGSRQTINGWVSENTEEMIPELLPRGSIDTLTRMVLTNAIYFLADWQTPFPPELTQPSDFHTTARTVTVPMMGTTRYLRHGEGIGYKTLELPYKGNRISMLIFLPDEGELAAFEQSLDTGRLDEILAGMSTRYVMVRLPRFEIEAKASLAGLLSRLGMPLAFTEAADFSGVNGGGDPLFIKAVEHKAVVRVDEKGTEAAAATGVVAGTTSVPPQPVPFIADRPFLFVIRDGQTGTLLFVGRLSDPPEASGGAGLSAKEQKRPLQLRK
jgi:serpin B